MSPCRRTSLWGAVGRKAPRPRVLSPWPMSHCAPCVGEGPKYAQTGIMRCQRWGGGSRLRITQIPLGQGLNTHHSRVPSPKIWIWNNEQKGLFIFMFCKYLVESATPLHSVLSWYHIWFVSVFATWLFVSVFFVSTVLSLFVGTYFYLKTVTFFLLLLFFCHEALETLH